MYCYFCGMLGFVMFLVVWVMRRSMVVSLRVSSSWMCVVLLIIVSVIIVVSSSRYSYDSYGKFYICIGILLFV